MSKKIEQIKNEAELERLRGRAGKYLKFVLSHKKITEPLLMSTVYFVEGERQRAKREVRFSKPSIVIIVALVAIIVGMIL